MPRLVNISSNEMIKTIINAMYAVFIFIVLISFFLAGLTSYTFISQSSKSGEIINVIHDIYKNQKSVVINVIDLSKILIKDSSKSIVKENNDLLPKSELPNDLEDNTDSGKIPITEGDGNNPLGIVIEPSLPDSSEIKLPEITEEPLVKERKELSFDEIKMEMS